MQAFSNFMEKYFVPVANAMNNNKFIASIRDAFILNFPLIMTSSIVLLLNFVVFGSDLPFSLGSFEATKPIADFFISIGWPILQGTIDIMSISIAFLIGRNLAVQYKSDDIMGGLLGLASVFIVTVKNPVVLVENVASVVSGDKAVEEVTSTAFDPTWFQASGLFVAMIVPLFAVYIMVKFGKFEKLKIKLPDMVPPAVARSFNLLIPIIITLFILGIATELINMAYPEGLHVFIFETLQKPLQSMGQSIHTLVLLYTVSNFLWFFGIHGPNTTAAVREAIFSFAGPENLDYLQGGGDIANLPNVVHPGLYDSYANVGGSGMTLPLVVVMLWKGVREDYRQIAKLSFAPGLFNINETMIFGIPLVLNPIFFFPFVLVPTVVAYIAYYATTLLSFVDPIGYTVPWTAPGIIGTFFASGLNVFNAILAALLFILAMAMYYPFVKIADGQVEEK